MANISRNIDKIYSKYMHKPTIKGAPTIPLYAKVEGYNGESDILDSNREAKECSIRSFSSPNNVRRIFITHDRVVLQLYKPFMVNLKQDTSGKIKTNMLKEDDSMLKVGEKAIEQLIYRNNNTQDIIKITGNGLSGLCTPWVLSNIEEVYFDWTLLTSMDILNNIPDAFNILKEVVNCKQSTTYSSELPIKMLRLVKGNNNASLESRFPRLRAVCMISNLSAILSNTSCSMGDGRLGTTIESIRDYNQLWYNIEENKMLIGVSNSIVIINKIEKANLASIDFSLRDGIYKFDRLILKNYFEDYGKNITNIISENRKNEESIRELDVNNKSDVELLLNSIEEKYGKRQAFISLAIAGTLCGNKKYKEALEQMTNDGVKSYSS